MRIWMAIAIAGCGPISPAPGPSTAQPVAADTPHGVEPDREVSPGGETAPVTATDESDIGPETAADPALASPGGRGPTRGRGPAPAGKSQGISSEAQRLVDAHNRVRAKHCAKPLAWSAKLAQAAQQWANALRDKGCSFGHSGGSFGENLAAGTSGTLDAEDVVKMWYDEVAQYRFPNGGFSAQTGHFTQVVWRGTARVGCGRSQCNGMDIWVCEYDPAGNWQGQYRENVLPTSCR